MAKKVPPRFQRYVYKYQLKKHELPDTLKEINLTFMGFCSRITLPTK